MYSEGLKIQNNNVISNLSKIKSTRKKIAFFYSQGGANNYTYILGLRTINKVRS